jgi:uncharacterized protein YjbI with pentapeptide repeats
VIKYLVTLHTLGAALGGPQRGWTVENLRFRMRLMMIRAELTVRRLLFQVYLNRRKARLAGADLSFLNLSRLNLRGVNLSATNLTRADLSRTNLRQAILEGANLTGAILHGADLTDARLAKADVTLAQLADAKSLKGAIMPDGTRHD